MMLMMLVVFILHNNGLEEIEDTQDETELAALAPVVDESGFSIDDVRHLNNRWIEINDVRLQVGMTLYETVELMSEVGFEIREAHMTGERFLDAEFAPRHSFNAVIFADQRGNQMMTSFVNTKTEPVLGRDLSLNTLELDVNHLNHDEVDVVYYRDVRLGMTQEEVLEHWGEPDYRSHPWIFGRMDRGSQLVIVGFRGTGGISHLILGYHAHW